MRIRIYYEDTDAGGIVYHSNYIKFCERARSEFCFTNGVKFSKDRRFVVTKIVANYIKPAVLGDTIDVKTKVNKIGKASMILDQEIFRVASLETQCFELLFTAQITVAFICHGRVGKIDDELASLFSSKL